MSRSGYTDDCEHLELWRGTVARAIRGKRGQKLLRTLLDALDGMTAKRLVSDLLVDGPDVCLLGAGGRAMGIADLDKIDPEEHGILAQRFDVSKALIAEIEFVNDEENYHPETPEQRYERVRKWVVENIKEEGVKA